MGLKAMRADRDLWLGTNEVTAQFSSEWLYSVSDFYGVLGYIFEFKESFIVIKGCINELIIYVCKCDCSRFMSRPF